MANGGESQFFLKHGPFCRLGGIFAEEKHSTEKELMQHAKLALRVLFLLQPTCISFPLPHQPLHTPLPTPETDVLRLQYIGAYAPPGMGRHQHTPLQHLQLRLNKRPKAPEKCCSASECREYRRIQLQV